MTTYFTQLKEQYADEKEAYRAYVLGKTILRVAYCKEDAPNDILKAFKVQEQFNAFAKDLISNKDASLKKYLGLNSENELITYFKENEDLLIYIGIDRNMYIGMVTEIYNMNLYKASSSIDWNGLEKIIEEEKNNIPVMDETKAKEILKDNCEEYAVSSISFGKGRTNSQSINNVGESLNQLSLVLDCHKEQIGSNRFNLFFDTEEIQYAGYSNQFNKNQKLCLNERLSYDAFAHEWLHGVDSMMAQEQKLNATHASEIIEGGKNNIKNLLAETMISNQDSISKYKESVTEKTYKTLANTVDRYNKLGYLKNIEELKAYTKEIAKKISEDQNYWTQENIKTVKEKVKEYYTRNEICAYAPFIITEMSLLQHVKHSKTFNESLFYKYAVDMDQELIKEKMLEKGQIYSTERCEMFARSFETYTDIKLETLGVKNIISDSDVNSYMPRKEEMHAYLGKWNDVIDEMKETLNKIHPVNKIEIKMEKVSKDIVKNIKGIREKAMKQSVSVLEINKP